MSEPLTVAKDFISPDSKNTLESGASHFLICGLGSLGQYCVAKLKEFGVTVSAIDIAQPRIWEVTSVPNLMEDLVLGDCRQPEVLEQAKIQQYRAVLLVTSDERVIIDAAFAVRVLKILRCACART